jgi:NADH:ubiquinone oxidoreductase subunit C
MGHRRSSRIWVVYPLRRAYKEGGEKEKNECDSEEKRHDEEKDKIRSE